MLAYQLVAVEVFAIAFTFSAFTRNWLLSFGLVSALLFLIFSVSDFWSLGPIHRVYYQIWLPLVAISAGLAGHIYSATMKCPPLIRLTYKNKERKDGFMSAADLVTALVVLGGLSFVAGLNLWLNRTVIGLSAIGTEHETAGILLTVAGSLCLVIFSFVLLSFDVRARLTAKYVWIFCAWLLVFLLGDFLFYKDGHDSVIPEISDFAVYIGVTVVIALAAVYLPIRRHTDDKSGKPQQKSYDPFYRNQGYSWLYFGGIAFTIASSLMIFTAVASFPDSELWVGAVTMIVAAGISVVISFIFALLSPESIDRIVTNRPVFTKASFPSFIEMGTNDGINRQIIGYQSHQADTEFVISDDDSSN